MKKFTHNGVDSVTEKSDNQHEGTKDKAAIIALLIIFLAPVFLSLVTSKISVLHRLMIPLGSGNFFVDIWIQFFVHSIDYTATFNDTAFPSSLIKLFLSYVFFTIMLIKTKDKKKKSIFGISLIVVSLFIIPPLLYKSTIALEILFGIIYHFSFLSLIYSTIKRRKFIIVSVLVLLYLLPQIHAWFFVAAFR